MSISTTVYPKGDKGILIPQRPTTGEQDTYVTNEYLKDYRNAIGEGKLTGYKRFTKFAFNTLIKSGALKVLSNNLDIIHPGGKQLSIVSASAQDGPGGTGIRKVYLEYWDSDWVFRSEVIDMNGLTEVNTAATDIYRIEALYAILTGIAGTAVGAITMSDVPAGANVYAQIDQHRALFQRCLHYVAPGFYGVMPSVVASARTGGGVTFIVIMDVDFSALGGYSRMPVGVGELEHSSGGSAMVEISPPLALDNRDGDTGMAIGVVVAATTGTNQDGSAAFTVYEFP